MLVGQRIAIVAAFIASGIASVTRADVSISNKATANMSCSAGVCTATAQKALLNAADLQAMLASGDVAVKTGSVSKDIDIDQPLTWATTSRLTLDAQASVTVNKQMTVSGTGALTIVTNDNGGAKSKNKTGEFIIVPEHGSVQFWDLASSLIIDGNSYTLVGDIKTLAADVAANPSGFYALAKPYDASVDGPYADSPIATTFAGILEGLGNSVSHFSLETGNSGFLGFFSQIAPAGEIRDLAVVDGKLAGGQLHQGLWGMLVGESYGVINRCHSSGEGLLTGVSLGGLVGINRGLLEYSYANTNLGGTIGLAGGLVGHNNDDGIIRSSYALGSIALRKTIDSDVGGLSGYNEGVIENSFARTRLVAGKQEYESLFGGLVGENFRGAQISTSYAAGEITIKSVGDAGGLIGEDDSAAGDVQNAYWDLDKGIGSPAQGAGNIPNDPGINGLTDSQLKSGLPAGFDPKIWGSNPKINNGYPYLLANPPH